MARHLAEMAKNLTAIQETWVRSLGQEDTLEKRMAIYSSILAWRIPWTKESGGLYSPWGCKESERIEQLTLIPIKVLRFFDWPGLGHLPSP